MKGGRDDGKAMDPWLPRIHIDNANKGGPRPPPRNKMALCEPYDFSPGLFPLSTSSGRHRFVTSTSTIGSSKHKLVPTFSNVAGLPSHYPDPTNVKISVTNTKPATPLNCQIERASSSIITEVIECNPPQSHDIITSSTTRPGDNKAAVPLNCQIQQASSSITTEVIGCNPSQPHDIITSSSIMRPGDDNAHKNPHFLQLHPDKKICPVVPYGGELHKSCSNEQNDTRSLIYGTISRPTCTLNENTDVSHGKVSKDAALQRQCVKHKEKGQLFDEAKNDVDDTRSIPDRIVRKRCHSAVDDISCSYQLLEDDDRHIKNDAAVERSGVEELDPNRGSKDEIGQEHYDTSNGESIPRLELTTNDVVRLIGETLFSKARKMIVNQQHEFAVQIFELHRLVKVQSLIPGTMESQQNNSNLNKPYIKFPPINKLLYVSPLDQSSPVATKPNSSILKQNTGQDPYQDSKGKQPKPPINSIEGYNCQQPTSKPLLLHPLPADQWLVPVGSSSEGLVYKPCTGPCPPAFGVMAPSYGNCGPVHISSLAGPRPYGVPAPNHPRDKRLPLGQNCFRIPLLNSSCPSVEIEQSSGVVLESEKNRTASPPEKLAGAELSLKRFPLGQNYFKIPSLNSSCPSVEIEKSSGVVLESEENKTASPPEKLAGEELSLFPTAAPAVEVHKDQEKEQTVHAIKVIPHNPRSASESAARIFQTIQEERKAI